MQDGAERSVEGVAGTVIGGPAVLVAVAIGVTVPEPALVT
jgi:hypothetical protein